MPSLDIQNPGMPDLQFVLFVSALCTSDLETINVPPELRNHHLRPLLGAHPYRCLRRLIRKKRVLDLREGTELTLEACLSTIRTLLTEAGITTLTWDHPVSDPTQRKHSRQPNH